ncbi:DUF3667 domain-containing protein [Dysgonomonas sp. ZJ279]|uniref:DUF3667 domain-containing protein n=1 Tax=Dysgonomonas sp. ZJ279 TaxID=2709796 RepID=UPI0013EC84E3|nr:DUF3667 domain-containing protein [Dysgonomonas sp. ZJ279]
MMAEGHCKNCGNTTKNSYCDICGQSAKTERISSHYLWHEIQHGIFHVDKGIFYTIRELFVRPGDTLKEYLAGKRVNHFKPLAFVAILATIYGFITHYFHIYPEMKVIATTDTNASVDYSAIILDWIYTHYSLCMFLTIPFIAACSYLLFRKNGYNYFEHLIIFSYITGQQIIIYLLWCPVNYFFPASWSFGIAMLTSTIYAVWVLTQLFKKSSWTKAALKATLCLILTQIVFLIIMMVVVIIILLTKYYI